MVKIDEGLVCRDTHLRVFLAPDVIEQANASREHLRTGQEQRVSECPAYLLGFTHRHKTSIGIDKAVSPYKATQSAYLSGPETHLSSSRRFGFVCCGAARHGPETLVATAAELQDLRHEYGTHS